MSLPQLPQDKANHVIYGLALFVVSAYATRWVGRPDWANAMGLSIVCAAGAFKEFDDWLLNRMDVAAGLQPRHSVSIFDWLATVTGGLMGVLAAVGGV